MTSQLLTIGYEGLDLDAFVAELRDAGAVTVIDVRASAWSRKPGFSKRALGDRLAREGIEYLHLPGLGNPKAGREAVQSGDQVEFLGVYLKHLQSDAAQAALAQAIEVVTAGRTILLCLEHHPGRCHRMLVAAAIAQATGRKVQHLRPEKVAA